MTLPDSRSASKHPSLVLHFRCLLGSLGHHFGSFGGSFWESESFILGPGWALGSLKNSISKKAKKRWPPAYIHTSILEIMLVHIFNDLLVNFLLRFLDHFRSHLGGILGPQMEPKSIKNRFKIRWKFQSDF